MGLECPKAQRLCPSGALEDDLSTGQNQGRTEEHLKGFQRLNHGFWSL